MAMVNIMSEPKPSNMPESGSSKKVLYVTRNDGTDTRMSKECNSLRSQGYTVSFVGWDRSPDRQKSDPIPDIEKYVFTYASGFRSAGLLLSVWLYYVFLVKTICRVKPDIVHVVNEDMAIMVLPLKPFLGFKVVCDIYDSFKLRYAGKNLFVRMLAAWLCQCAWRYSDAILVTDEDRRAKLELRTDKTWVVPNYPVDPEKVASVQLESAASRIYLYVAGTLYKQRGLENITAILNRHEEVHVISAGWVYDDIAENFVKHRKVQFMGVLTPGESLGYAAACDAVIALYEPVNDNMLLASPNKIYDAMCVGRPVIINSETNISNWVVAQGVGYSCAYNDIEALRNIIREVAAKKQAGTEDWQHIRGLFEQGYSWTVAEDSMLNAYQSMH